MEALVKKLWLVWGICGLFMMVACGGGNQTPPPPPPPLKITSPAPTSGTVSINYRGFTPAASGGSPPYNWSWAASPGSSLPPGLLISNSGIYGSPTTAGSYNVVITVQGSTSPPNHGTANYPIQIVDLGSISIVTFPPPPAAPF
jgi:hypothetical protein